jgi:hypothetical protein
MIFSTLALSSSAVFAAPTSPQAKSIKVQGYVEVACTHSISLPDMTKTYGWNVRMVRLENSEKSFDYQWRLTDPPKEKKFCLQGKDLALSFWGPTVTVAGKAITLSQPLTKQKDALTSYDKDTKIDKTKIVEYAMLNTKFIIQLPRCTNTQTEMTYGQPIEGELKFRNLQ